ncbi:MAG: tripartite tricarboxylate transporter substrate binding protein [Hydrogenophaga sp.]|nr:tripartite tricarboxylate transporter substrate binding protein [Hydrogenophaga sp.]
MKISRRNAILSVGALSLGASWSSHANTWPTQPLKMVIGFSPGGAADLVGRALAPEMQRQLGQPLIMDYRPGAGGAIAATAVARSSADGYLLYLADTGGMSVIPHLRQVGYDPVADFTPISCLGSSGLVVLAHPQLPVTDIPSLIKLLKEKPDSHTYASSGLGSASHLATELFKQMTGTQIQHIAYRGGAPALTDLMAGTVNLGFATIAPALQLIQAGKVRALGVTSPKRSPSLPQVPTLVEQGVAAYDATFWFAIVGPPRLPKAIASRLQSAFATVLRDKEVVASLERLGSENVGPQTPEALTQLLREDLAKWGRVIRTANIKLEG